MVMTNNNANEVIILFLLFNWNIKILVLQMTQLLICIGTIPTYRCRRQNKDF